MIASGGRRNGGSRRRPEFLLPPEGPSVAGLIWQQSLIKQFSCLFAAVIYALS